MIKNCRQLHTELRQQKLRADNAEKVAAQQLGVAAKAIERHIQSRIAIGKAMARLEDCESIEDVRVLVSPILTAELDGEIDQEVES